MNIIKKEVKLLCDYGEIRLNPDMTVDEVIAKGVDVHIEQMDCDHWLIIIDGKKGRSIMLNFFRDGKDVCLTVEEEAPDSSNICKGLK